jgi:hypothetical protein
MEKNWKKKIDLEIWIEIWKKNEICHENFEFFQFWNLKWKFMFNFF